MPIHGFEDNETGDKKPKYANTASVFGVSATEVANTDGHGPKVAHAGWVKQTLGTGGVASITIDDPGSGINANGFIVFTGGGGSGANASYVVSSNADPTLNVVVSVTLHSPGSGYTSAPTAATDNDGIDAATFVVTAGGRAGRVFYETLVAGGSMTGDDPDDDTYFPGE